MGPHRAARTRTALAVAAGIAVTAAGVAPATGDTHPPKGRPATVTADLLPTVQVNGVVWDQVVVGGTVYATGSFSTARPAGAAPGTKEVRRSNLLAYSLKTGKLVTSFAPTLNAQGLSIDASADGRTLYVGGDFTKAGGKARARVAAIEASTGKVRAAFRPGLNGRVRAVEVRGSVVYVGGGFTTAAGRKRSRLAAFDRTSGKLLTWRADANREVWAITAPPESSRVVVGGSFTTLNGKKATGMGAVSAKTGKVGTWKVNAVVRNSGPNSAITSLTSDASRVYGTGFNFNGSGNLEGAFAASVATGTLSWVNGCRGDHYDTLPTKSVLYAVSHTHNCEAIGTMPEQSPRMHQRAMAWTTKPALAGTVNTSGRFVGRRSAELLHWLPTLTQGTYTGQNQGPWTVEGDGRYIALGGEFPTVNGTPQQGLARFAVSSVAPDRQGPRGHAELRPQVVRTPAGVRVSWTGAWDRDNRRLTFEVLRGESAGSAEVVHRTTVPTAWWHRPAMSAEDPSAPAGALTYRVRVSDPSGNVMTSDPTTIAP